MPAQQKYPVYLEDQREFFDTLIREDWDTYFSEEWDLVRRHEVRAIFAHVQPARILDIGCGCGFHDREMAQYDFVRQVDAIDYSAASIEKAEQYYGHPKVWRWVANLNALDAANRYDLVVSFQVIEHLKEAGAFLARCAALCVRDGHVAVVTPNRRRLGNVIRMLRFQSPAMLDPQHFREFTVREITDMAARHGLERVAHFGYGMHGLGVIDRLSSEQRMRLGATFPSIAHQFCAIFRKTA